MPEPPTTRIGETNRHRQRVLLKGPASLDGIRGQRIYVLQCQLPGCGYEYGEIGLLLHDRKCPHCQGGKRGLPLPDAAPLLF